MVKKPMRAFQARKANIIYLKDLCPVASSLGLLLVVATAFHTPLPLTEGFTNDATSNIPQSTAGKAGEHMIHITKKIFELREKMCDYNAKCLNRTAALAAPDLNLPKLTEKDKCSPTALNKEICLMRITIELLEFQIYLEYIQNKFRNDEENARAKDVQISLQVETELLMQKKIKQERDINSVAMKGSYRPGLSEEASLKLTKEAAIKEQVAEVNDNSLHPAQPRGIPRAQPEGYAHDVVQASRVIVRFVRLVRQAAHGG
ncbi:interleukin-6-like [Oryctolagus cuniculus]|uniref:interleukin-6-like n=1 Tax=Oryctolagus cuniculus TaxID=9986 RepID=UPI00387A2B87